MQLEDVRLKIRELQSEDYNLYMDLAREHRLFRRFYVSAPEETKRSYWKMVTESGAEYFSIFEKETGEFCGSLSVQYREEKQYYQYSIDILGKFQHMGYGRIATKMFMDWIAEERDCHYMFLEIPTDNIYAKSMFEKLGAKEQEIDLNDTQALRQMIENATGSSSASNVKKYELEF